ncbi:MAG: hypothetical protein GY856_42890 [bacterium]|nr:hypothetical protein [bacterium]
MITTDAQVRRLMEKYQKDGQVEKAALSAGMHRNTAGKYLRAGKLPSELAGERTWRTRRNPFELDWADVVERLELAPELEAKTLFDDPSALGRNDPVGLGRSGPHPDRVFSSRKSRQLRRVFS